MIGVAEIIFSIILFCALWFFIFKFVLKYEDKKNLKNIVKKMEDQDKKIFIEGKEFSIKEKLKLDKNYSKGFPIPTPEEKPKEEEPKEVIEVPMKTANVFPYGDVPVVDREKLKEKIKEGFKK